MDCDQAESSRIKVSGQINQGESNQNKPKQTSAENGSVPKMDKSLREGRRRKGWSVKPGQSNSNRIKLQASPIKNQTKSRLRVILCSASSRRRLRAGGGGWRVALVTAKRQLRPTRNYRNYL
jgi:hypothetical protein